MEWQLDIEKLIGVLLRISLTIQLEKIRDGNERNISEYQRTKQNDEKEMNRKIIQKNKGPKKIKYLRERFSVSTKKLNKDSKMWEITNYKTQFKRQPDKKNRQKQRKTED